MAIPVGVLLAAAYRLAQDERAQSVARSLWTAGGEAIEKRRKRKAEPPALPSEPPAVADGAGSRGLIAGIGRRRRFRDGQAGDLIRFTFTDEHGLVTQRLVGNWRCERGELIGYCLHRKQELAFPVSGIGAWAEIAVDA